MKINKVYVVIGTLGVVISLWLFWKYPPIPAKQSLYEYLMSACQLFLLGLAMFYGLILILDGILEEGDDEHE